ncbi:MAG: DUF4912 domain-containing protein [Spirochaetales bacterium]|nr:DUF4912 domain-containing protein [Spirochaetales bacterium]
MLRIAERNRIQIPQGVEKTTLEDLIFEAFEDERLEREGNDNLTIRIEAKKYSVSQDEELFLDFDEEIELPDRYRENSLVLMLRDPAWVYCYWDVEDRILDELKDDSSFTGFILRVTELAAADWGKDSCIDWFDIPIQFTDLRRYINLPTEDTCYGVELYAQVGETEELIARSNIVESSRDYPALSLGDENSRREKLIALAGFSTDVGQFPGKSSQASPTPQRIIGGSGQGAS